MLHTEKNALITGASSGIGRALCQEFARHGYDLIITARSGDKLERIAQKLREVYGVQVHVMPADLTHKDSPKKLYEQIKEKNLSVDVLVNNAGFGYGGYFMQNQPNIQERMIRLNVLAPTRLCRLFLPDMAARKRGRILNLASTGSFVAGPMNGVYCASKAYVLSLSEALAEEVSGLGITVTALCPGATRTGFAHNARMQSTRLFRYGVLEPVQVARIGYRALMEGRRVAVAGGLNQAMMQACRLIPRILPVKVSRYLQTPYLP